MTHRIGNDDHVVEPKAREKEVKEDKIFDVCIDVTFRHGGGQDDQDQDVFGKKMLIPLLRNKGLIFLP
jgi:hypothetical protein